MAGTDRSRRAVSAADPEAPAVVLVEPQLGENIGAAARAMLNFGLTDLRLVAPRGDWPNRKAVATASGAEAVLDGARMFSDTETALGDIRHVLATTARTRDMVKPVLTPRTAARRLRDYRRAGERAALLFGREKSGLQNDDAARAEALVIVPANPAYSSINLAQAVLLIGYEWYQVDPAVESGEDRLVRKGAHAATQQEIRDLFVHLEAELDDCGFLYPPDKRPRMVRNIRNIFTRAGLTDQEVRTLRGIIAGLAGRRPGRQGALTPTEPIRGE